MDQLHYSIVNNDRIKDGLYCGYVDFISWDIRAVLNKAEEFFAETDIPWASFHTFRREAGTVTLKDVEVLDDGRD